MAEFVNPNFVGVVMVSEALLVSRLTLAAVFAAAGFTKLLDPSGLRTAMRGLRVPTPLIGPLATGLPVTECALALLLVLRSSAWYGAVGSLVLLVGFTAVIAANLMQGRTPDCHCFGQVRPGPIGRATLARNTLLLAVATFVVGAGGGDAGLGVFDWLGRLSSVQEIALLGGVTGLALLLWQTVMTAQLVRQSSDLVARLNASTVAASARLETSPPLASAPILPATAGLPLGRQAPSFALPDLDGFTVTLDALRDAGKPVVLVFSDSECGPCAELMPEIARWQRDHSDVMLLAVVSRGTPDANRPKSENAEVTPILLQRDREVANTFGVIGTPSAVLIHIDGRVGSLLAQGAVEIRQLVTMLTASSAPSVAAQPAVALAPDFALPDLDGKTVALADFRGMETLLLFWNPSCGHCQQMLPELRAWEAQPPTERAQLLVVSTGSADANRALNLRSPILLDSSFGVGATYGVQGTPSGALLDADGRLAAPLAIGAAPIFALVAYAPNAAESVGSIVPVIAMLEPGTRPIRLNCVHDELLPDGSLVLYNGCRREVMTLNPTAALAWEYCDGETAVETIVAEVRSVFPEAADVDRDVRDLLDRLLRAGAIAPSGGAAETAAQPIATT